MQDNRGSIIDREKARQLRDFRGLRYGNITPTDIDGLIEYHNKAYVLFELKQGTIKLPFGQKLALERITDDLAYRKPALCIIASHNTPNNNDDIDTANASVTEYRLKGKWYMPNSKITIKEIIDLFLNNIEIGAKDFHSLCAEHIHAPEKIPLATFMK